VACWPIGGITVAAAESEGVDADDDAGDGAGVGGTPSDDDDDDDDDEREGVELLCDRAGEAITMWKVCGDEMSCCMAERNRHGEHRTHGVVSQRTRASAHEPATECPQ